MLYSIFTYIVLIIVFGILIYALRGSNKNKENIVREFNDVILNSEEMERHAAELAQNQSIMKNTKLSYMLVPRMNKNYNYIKSVYRNLNRNLKDTAAISQDDEWLLDNFYVIEEQVKEIRKSLSKGYYSGLPGLKNSLLKGYPRIYAIALELVLHTDGRIDEKTIVNFIRSYQSRALLSSGELWALSLMIRIALIENIKRVCEKITETRKQWQKADSVADFFLSKAEIKYGDVKNVIHENVKAAERFPLQFIEHLLNRLRKEGNSTAKIIQYIDKVLQEYDTNISDITDRAHQLQAARQVSMGNAIVSLKMVSALDWAQIFELLSPVEQILRQDPDGTYPKMDFESRDYYRHEIEKIAKSYNTSETYVARKAIECAKEIMNDNSKLGYINHVGFYLIGRGRSILENKISHRANGFRIIRKKIKMYSESFYLGLFAAGIAVIEMFFLSYTWNLSKNIWLTVAAGIIILIPASEISVEFINWILLKMFKPTIIPKIELNGGIPENASTIVVIPSLLPDEKRTEELIENLEVYYHANKEKNLYFALIGDFKDAPQCEMPDDEKIINCAQKEIKKLNEKYAEEGKDIFYYFHRKRQYNKLQNAWMGWERKRGALVEFNELLRGSHDTSFYVVSGDITGLLNIKYVITLDADTNLPIDAAKRLIGTMLHPLNRAVIDKESGIVVEGYGLLQPRISVSIASANMSLFSRIFAGQGGIDPYTTAVSDIYQDLFGEGIYTGKGIYDVDVFRSVLRDAIPDNSVLSHDLLEGSFVRAGLVTDIELIDGYPSKYNSYVMRLHRWTRGDWQLLPYLSSRIKNKKGEIIDNPLPLISKWKIIDNLRRSLVSPALVLLIFSGFSILPGNSLIWLGIAALTAFFPLVTVTIDTITKGQFKHYREKRHAFVIHGIKASIYQTLLLFTFLPYQAYLMVDAVIRTVTRVYFTKRNLLEWVTAADMEQRLKNDLKSFLRRMWVSALGGIILLVLAVYFKPTAWPYAFLLFILWSISPYLAFYISKPFAKKAQDVSDEDISELRKIARKTWRFFEEFVVESENFLPPDNIQEEPPSGIAERTSPTNIGLYLVSVAAARDMGFIGTLEMLNRIEKTLNTVERMDKWNGHLYNWYNTRTLEPLKPYYVSTVDSGNFIGYLIALKEAVKEYVKKPLVDTVLLRGLKDTINVAEDETEEKILDKDFEEIIDKKEITAVEWKKLLDKIYENINAIEDEKKQKKLYRVKCLLDAFKKEIRDLLVWVEMKEGLETSNYTSMETKAHKILDEYTDIFESEKSIEGLLKVYKDYLAQIDETLKDCDEKSLEIFNKHKVMVSNALYNIQNLINKCDFMVERMMGLIDETKFKPLYDEKRQLFSIGYNVEDEKLTKSYYDLLASEARQASFIAIAKKEVDRKHWFRLGRMLTVENQYKGLVSWSGTMFEYFMPLLVMKNYENTLFDETYAFVVTAQKNYSKKLGIPWGISESGFYSFDINLNYQYKAFGVPSLGLKRGLSFDRVVAPYGTLLAITVDPQGALENIKRLRQQGMEGRYGFYESIDYTPERVPFGKDSVIVKSFMAHHQGMSFIALNNFLNGNIMQIRFHSDPMVKAAEILLQEKIKPSSEITREEKEEIKKLEKSNRENGDFVRVLGLPKNVLPEAHILSNGRYSVMLTDSGTGYSKNDGIYLTRWRNDVKQDLGTFIFVQNINSNTAWAVTHAPFYTRDEHYKVSFSSDKAEYFKKVGNIDTHMEIIVSPEDNAEIRKVSFKNHSKHPRTLEVTSFFEVSLTDLPTDVAHQAFNKLFVKTEFVKSLDAILAYKKPREQNQKQIWAVHAVAVHDAEIIGDTQYETDRSKFIGRGRTLSNPIALDVDQPLSNTIGAVLDPVMSVRKRIKLMPGQIARVTYVTAMAEDRADAIKIAEKYRDESAVERAFEMAWTRSRVELDYLNAKTKELGLYQKMIAHILFLSPQRKLRQSLIGSNRKGQSGLWAYGISGDIPVVLVEVESAEETDIIMQLLKAHEYWKMKGLSVDLVILNQDKSGYIQPLNDKIKDIISGSFSYDAFGKHGGVYLLQGSNMPDDDIFLLNTVAKLKFKGKDGSLYEQMAFEDVKTSIQNKIWSEELVKYGSSKKENMLLDFYNGLGGFSTDGKEYIINLIKGISTPVPWINVIANSRFGFQVSESGAGYTWAENSREYKLTPWYNDPVLDPPGEVFYLRDEISGVFWTITPSPSGGTEPYYIKHGFGYTIFKNTTSGIEQELVEFVPTDSTVKINIIKLKNISGKKRKLTITHYLRPVLGVSDQLTAPYISTDFNNDLKALLIRNVYSDDFPDRIAFMCCSESISSFTGDRLEFMGVIGDLSHPEAMKKEKLSNTTGAGLDPCGALQVEIEIGENEEKEIAFLIGSGRSQEEIISTIKKYRDVSSAKNALKTAKVFWNNLLGTIKVNTPDKSMNLMLNGWLLYQTISCRIWARSAFYQSGGAYGFRDQLQDTMNVVYVVPELTRAQILNSCEHQFIEGDVQHWWHPVANKGIRTRYSDDLLWLPYVTADYVVRTEDWSILDLELHYLKDEPLREGEDERYNKPEISDEKSTVYEHCIRAIEYSLRFGDHGLPLMGSGDWNDGMNMVGNKGKGESVWLGWFLYTTLKNFAPVCRKKGDEDRASKYEKTAEQILENIEKNAWDGSWYIRAYFDDGTPLGSTHNSECKIDSIAQSWAVISNAAKQSRAKEAMEAVLNYLVSVEDGIVKLLTPPFDTGELNPGYIKGYVPGVRENGGQYTHAAVWIILAFAKLGDGDKAWQLYNMINPINHARTPIECARYKVEPYVMAADVYAVEPHTGRGGWTWYTGAAGWMYRVGIEHILGFKKNGNVLTIDPCIPKDWSQYSMEYNYKDNTKYIIEIKNPESVNKGVKEVYVDGNLIEDKKIKLKNDNIVHKVEVLLGN